MVNIKANHHQALMAIQQYCQLVIQAFPVFSVSTVPVPNLALQFDFLCSFPYFFDEVVEYLPSITTVI